MPINTGITPDLAVSDRKMRPDFIRQLNNIQSNTFAVLILDKYRVKGRQISWRVLCHQRLLDYTGFYKKDKNREFMMLIKNKKSPVLIGLVAAMALAGCEGNSSSSNTGPLAVITPIEVDTKIGAVEWDQENVAEKASHAYRAIIQNTMVKTVFTNQLSSFDLLANLFRVSEVRGCAISGRMIAKIPKEECFLADNSSAQCDSDKVAISKSSQESRAIACQDGGKYLDGFFNIIKTTDESEPTELRTSTAISAVGEIAKVGVDGNQVLDEYGDPVFEEISNYQFQTEAITFFFEREYESYVNFLKQNLICGDKEYREVEIQGIKSAEVGAFEGDGTAPYFQYTKFTDLDMRSTPIETCNSDDTLNVDYSYSFKATMESAAMGGGEDSKTLANWSDMEISTSGTPSGTLTLTHENEGSVSYTVTLDFNTDGQVTITAPDLTNPLTPSLSDFLGYSKPSPYVSESSKLEPEAAE